MIMARLRFRKALESTDVGARTATSPTKRAADPFKRLRDEQSTFSCLALDWNLEPHRQLRVGLTSLYLWSFRWLAKT
jgi:hypothetical protein